MANIYDNPLLQNIFFPKTPELGENLYNPPGIRMLASRIRPALDRGVNSIFGPSNLMPDSDYPEYAEVDMGATGIIPTLALDNTGIISTLRNNVPFGTSVDNIQGFTDKEDFSTSEEKSGIAKLFEFLQQFSPSGMVMGGLNALGSMLNFKDSPMYRPAGIGVYGYTPKELNRMNALGGYYSEPMRAYRRNVNRISNLMQRAAAGKNYSQKNLNRLMDQAGMGDVDTRGMIDSIKTSSETGYGIGDVGQTATPGRDYSSSPGAMAGDMEYGEE